MVFNSHLPSKKKVNAKPQGFDFDQSMFENMIDAQILPGTFKEVFNCTGADLDRFCQSVYNMNFIDAYRKLHEASVAEWKRTFGTLARNGSQTAMKIVAEDILKLNQENRKKEFRIQICSELPTEDEYADEEKE